MTAPTTIGQCLDRIASQANQSITFFMPQWIALLAMTAG
jgi:hypothetical protein